MRAFTQWWSAHSTADRRVLLALVSSIGVALFAWLLLSTVRARAQLLPAVTQLRAQAARQSAQADEIERLRALPPAPASTAGLRPLVQRQVDASGLAETMVSVDLVDARHVKLVFGSVAFTDWLRWADAMRAQRLRFAAVRIEAQAPPGRVSVTATVERPGR